jgi:hypothetical protein
MKKMRFLTLGACATSLLIVAGPVSAGDPSAAHDKFKQAFNERQWEDVKAMLADDAAFHRANADEVQVGPEEITARFEEVIGNPDQWNVKFVRLDPTETFEGIDGRVVERGDFAVTAGGDDSGCYVGSYMMTWLPEDDDWKLQALNWQDVETDVANCQ